MGDLHRQRLATDVAVRIAYKAAAAVAPRVAGQSLEAHDIEDGPLASAAQVHHACRKRKMTSPAARAACDACLSVPVGHVADCCG
mmetsp:Transcript_23454/g.54679  ORF Transcript_23454/g.54679 Transcript_23454/m.54679 type:complete len:85 (-) Transcript_23454:601-855(-)|eukprot:CAMPEP_0178419536 /NCGR_PEP_ID=MMETSP0689_2-20121128/25662_1 /TAXON_ID=160604 /ORGANISM="Amphidinium massartii, Strain CS-259" /LENGTH=84 /DNA_ID=CAMNT_0020040979 /DNA_START=58 /DNA_END=312 /DNA_ORIENTATION=+